MTPARDVAPTGPASDADVPGWWRALGVPALADIHVHVLPDRMQEKVWSFFDARAERDGVPWPIQYREDRVTRLRRLRALGLAAIPALTYPHKPGMAAWLNDWGAELAAAEPDVLHCATFHPEPEAATYLPRALADGARLVKAHVQVGGYDPRDPLLEPVWGALEDAAVPVVIHCGSRPTPGPHTGTAAIAEVLRRHPDLVLVIAHLGMDDYHGFADLAERHDGVHLDTTMAATDFVQARWPMPADYPARLAGLRDKVVLGSDFPSIPYPYAHQLQALARLDLGADWLRAVLWENGARLLRLDPPRRADLA